MIARFAAALGLVTALAVGAPAHADDSRLEEARAAAGAQLFDRRCRVCHADELDGVSYGPPLANIVGRGAGTYPEYDFSIALMASGIVWTEAALRAWMEDNVGFLPGTKMRHVGVTDRAEQDFILAYLKSISQRDAKAISE